MEEVKACCATKDGGNTLERFGWKTEDVTFWSCAEIKHDGFCFALCGERKRKGFSW